VHVFIAGKYANCEEPTARAIRHRFAIAALLATLGCVARPPAKPGLYLVEKGQFQALYGPDGHIQRLVFDADGDAMGEVVILFGDGGIPSRAEIDTDGDGVVDRREAFDQTGALSGVTTEAAPKPGAGSEAAATGRSLARPVLERALALGVGTELNLNRPQTPAGGSR
jgi:hypothetical protein